MARWLKVHTEFGSQHLASQLPMTPVSRDPTPSLLAHALTHTHTTHRDTCTCTYMSFLNNENISYKNSNEQTNTDAFLFCNLSPDFPLFSSLPFAHF